jgi:hypothetical protein
MSFRTLSSEFPNANFELHDGAIWISARPAGRAKAVVRPRRTEAIKKLEPLELEPLLPTTPEPAVKPVPVLAVESPGPEAPPPSDDFPRLVEALVSVLLEAGATRAAASVKILLEGGAIQEPILQALEKNECGFELATTERETARTWRAILGGHSDDLSSCENTLDTWCAELCARLSGKPAEDLRKALRRHGIAAFGLLAA